MKSNDDIFNFNEGKTYNEIVPQKKVLTEEEKNKIRKDMKIVLLILIISSISMILFLFFSPFKNKNKEAKSNKNQVNINIKDYTEFLNINYLTAQKPVLDSLYSNKLNTEGLNLIIAYNLFKNNKASCNTNISRKTVDKIINIMNISYPQKLTYYEKGITYLAVLSNENYQITCQKQNVNDLINTHIKVESKKLSEEMFSVKHYISFEKDAKFYYDSALTKEINSRLGENIIVNPSIYEFIILKENNKYILKGISKNA